MKTWIIFSLIIISSCIEATHHRSVPWHYIQVDSDPQVHPANIVLYMSELQDRYEFTREETLRIIGGISESPRITYIAETGKILTYSPQTSVQKPKKKKVSCSII